MPGQVRWHCESMVTDMVITRSLRAHSQSPFEFNLFSLSFPTLCLRCLSAPPSLSFGTTISKDRCWSIDPPNSYHFEALRRWLGAKMRDWRLRRKALGVVRPLDQNGTNGDRDHDWYGSTQDSEADEHEAACATHLSDAYQAWQNLSEMQKHEKWHSECVAALTQEQDRHRDTRDRMERLEQQVQSLQSELNARNGNQAPSSFPIPQQSALQTFDRSTDLAAWDYDKLITKWRTRVQNERAQQHPLPAPPSPWTASTPDTARSPPYVIDTNHHRPLKHPTSRSEHSHAEPDCIDADEDLVDAPGEEDDIEPVGSMHHNLLDPNLRQRSHERQDTVMRGGGSRDGG